MAIGCPGKVRKFLSYLYSSFLALGVVVLVGSAGCFKPWQVCVREQQKSLLGHQFWGGTWGVLRLLVRLVLPL